MPRRPSPRTPDHDTSTRDNGARQGWVRAWKARAVGQLPNDAPVAIKAQLRVDVERALARYRPDDDEAEVGDVVATVVQEAQKCVAAEAAAQAREVANKRAITLAPIYLRIALAKHDRRLVAAMLRRPGSRSTDLATRLRRHLARHLQGDEDVSEVQTLVDAWVDRRLSEQPSEPKGVSKSVVTVACTAIGAAGVVAYQNQAVKTMINQGAAKGLAKARQLLEQWKASQKPPEPPPQGGSDAVANR